MLTLSQQLNLLDLYDYEIRARISQHFSKIKPFEALIHDEEKELYAELYAVDTDKFSKHFWQCIRYSPLNSTLYDRVLEFLTDVDVDLHAMICVENYVNLYIVGFLKILEHTTELMDAMRSVHNVLTELQAINGLSEIVEPLLKRHECKTISDERVKKILFRHIPLLTVYGYEHLLYALSSCGDDATTLINKIYRNFLNEYEHMKQTINSPHGLFHVILPTENVGEKISEAVKKGANCSNVFHARVGKLPSFHRRPYIIDYAMEYPLNLRNYQKELVVDACEGKNSIICAPTGSGKTIVAAYIIRDHFYRAIQQNRKAKICFLVPTQALVEQQEKVLLKYIQHCAQIVGISGMIITSTPYKETIEKADIIICTPQIILNLLDESRQAASGNVSALFLLSTFTMLIFDEAHHADEKHPYNGMLCHYHELKLRKLPLPQIVGMTASLGTGGAKGLTDAISYTLKMCANLDAHCLSRVRRFRAQLTAYTSELLDVVSFVDMSECCSQNFFIILNEAIFHFENKIDVVSSTESALSSAFTDVFSNKNFPNRMHPAYEQWISSLSIQIQQETELNAKCRECLLFCVEQLKILFKAVQFLFLFGSEIALQFINESEAVYFKTKNANVMTFLQSMTKRLLAEPKYESPMFIELTSTLNKQFLVNAESRAIVFAKTREYCLKLSELLNKCTQLKTSYLTGAQSGIAEGGQNASQQKKAIIDFTEGRVKALCATTVAEEGLDIPACNLIIEYNNVANDIGRIQRRGRGRAKNAKSVLITLDEQIKKQSEQNLVREQLMALALDAIDNESKSWFTTEIDKKLAELREERLREKALMTERAAKMDNTMKYALKCRKCDGFLSFSDKVRVFSMSNYAIVDVGIWKRVSVGALPDDDLNKHLARMPSPHIGVLFCSTSSDHGVCANKLGRVIIHNDVKLPTLSCKNIAFVKVDLSCKEGSIPTEGGRFLYDQWKKITSNLFIPNKISDLNLKEMQLAERCRLDEITSK